MTHDSLRQCGLAATLVTFTALVAGACSVDKNTLLAPSDSRIVLAAAAPLVAVNDNVNVTIQVLQNDGSPVEDGTEVLISASRGDFDRTKVRTRGGNATAMYQAAPEPGPVELQASSDQAQGTTQLAITSGRVASISLVASPAALPFNGGQVNLKATVFSGNGERIFGAPVTFQANTGSIAQPVIITNDQGEASAKLSASSAAVAKATVHLTESNNLTIEVEAPLDLVVQASPATGRVGDPVTFTVTPTDLSRRGEMSFSFGDGQSQDLGDGTGVRSTSYTYSQSGGFNVSATFTSTLGSEVRQTVRFNVAPAISPLPPPGASPNLPGIIDDPALPFSLSDVGWLHTDVSRWAETSRISSVDMDLENGHVKTICFPHSKAGRWPIVEGGEGNVWVLGEIGGRWYAGTFDWLKKGQTCKSSGNDPRRWYWDDRTHGIGAHVHKSPLENWAPQSGEMVGIMVSTHARFGQQGIAERSNVFLIRWP